MVAPASLLETVMRAVADPGIDPARLREFLEIGKDLEAIKAKKEYVAAFLAAKRDMDGIKITRRGKIIYAAKGGKPGGVVRFARYDDIADVVKPILAKHDLAATYNYEYTNNPPKVICVMTLTHRGGHSQEFRSVPLPMVDSSGGKNDIQGAGSVASYGRRYIVCPVFDVVAEGEDDDGSGLGAPEVITEEQARQIEDIVEACHQRDPKFRAAFAKWLAVEFQVDSPAALYQGAQRDAVLGKLHEKMAALGIK